MDSHACVCEPKNPREKLNSNSENLPLKSTTTVLTLHHMIAHHFLQVNYCLFCPPQKNSQNLLLPFRSQPYILCTTLISNISELHRSKYLLSDFWEGGSIFFLQISIVKVGEGRRCREGSRFPQLPDVKPSHSQQHEEAHQVDPHLPARRITYHWKKVQKTSAYSYPYFHFINGRLELCLITVFSLVKMGF